ncbi:THAP domain-containing protein 5 isoform 1-T2 [Leptodactylus fuscus]|uniref:THAP domain-containing protein 5 n=1 Tax=Leptodactylus fuscus TaxID=238119 RepID=UPI003F4F0112
MTLELHHASLDNMLINPSAVSKMSFDVPLVEMDDVSGNLHRFHVDNSSNKPHTSDKSLVFTAITQTIEQLGSTEESVITIIVPEDISKKQTILTSQPFLQDHQVAEEEKLDMEYVSFSESDSAEETLEMEHSYCRNDFDRDHLWDTIVKLQSKVALLEVQETVTLARLKSLEALIGLLKQENLLSDDKLKLIDECQSNLDFAVIQ